VRCRFRGASESARAVRSYFALAARSSSSRTAQKMYAGLRRPISSPIASSTLWDNPGGDTPRRRLPGHPGGEAERHHDRGPRGAAHGAGILARRRHSDGHPHRVPRPTHRRPQDIVRTVRGRGAVLRATEQPIDTGKAAGKCFLDMLGVFAEFETNLRRERQLEGIAKAKAAGVYKGRPPSIEASRVRELRAQGMRPSDIARRSRSAGRPSTGF
jgi:hypothetical protein